MGDKNGDYLLAALGRQANTEFTTDSGLTKLLPPRETLPHFSPQDTRVAKKAFGHRTRELEGGLFESGLLKMGIEGAGSLMLQ